MYKILHKITHGKITVRICFISGRDAQVVELVDTLVSGASAKSMLVRVQSRARLS